MKNTRFLALLMAVLMCLSLLPLGALADEEIAEAPEALEEVAPAPEPAPEPEPEPEPEPVIVPEPEPEPAPAEEILPEEPAEGIEPEPEAAPEPAEAVEEPAAPEEPVAEAEAAEAPAEEEPAEEAPVEADEIPAPAPDGAGEAPYIDEDGAICVTSFADLEGLLLMVSEEDFIWIRVISGSTFVLERSISIPASVWLEFGSSTTVSVPAGVTVTNYGYLDIYNFKVIGTLWNYGELYLDDLGVGGLLVNRESVYVYGTLTGAENIRTSTVGENEPFVVVIRHDKNNPAFLDTVAMARVLPDSVYVHDYLDGFVPNPTELPDNMDVRVTLYPNSEAELRSIAQTVSASFEGHRGWNYLVSLNGQITVSRNLTIPRNMTLTLGEDLGDSVRVTALTISSGVTLTVNGAINAKGGSISINGTLMNNGTVFIGENDNTTIGRGSIALRSGGKYSGLGTLTVLSKMRYACMSGFPSSTLYENDDGNYTYFWVIMNGYWIQDSVGYRFQFEDGTYAASLLLTFDTGTWYFTSAGYLYLGTGWQKIGDDYYYFISGSMVTGLKQIGGKWYYFNEDGTLFTGWLPYGGAVYYYSMSTGNLVSGWQQIGSHWYYFDPGTFKMVTGLKLISGAYYLFNENGTIYLGWLDYQGAKYYYDTVSGKLTVGWKQIGGSYYYFITSTAKMVTGWVKYNGYYFYTDTTTGKMYASGTYLIDGVSYTFNDYGVCIG